MGLQLLLRLLDRGRTYDVAEGHAGEVKLDVPTIGGRPGNRGPEQAHRGEVQLTGDPQQPPRRRFPVLDLDEEPRSGLGCAGQPDAGRSWRHPTLRRDGRSPRDASYLAELAKIQPELPSEPRR